jgi:hypothetical protein
MRPSLFHLRQYQMIYRKSLLGGEGFHDAARCVCIAAFGAMVWPNAIGTVRHSRVLSSLLLGLFDATSEINKVSCTFQSPMRNWSPATDKALRTDTGMIRDATRGLEGCGLDNLLKSSIVWITLCMRSCEATDVGRIRCTRSRLSIADKESRAQRDVGTEAVTSRDEQHLLITQRLRRISQVRQYSR